MAVSGWEMPVTTVAHRRGYGRPGLRDSVADSVGWLMTALSGTRTVAA
jgi:hypothetical protein